MDFKPKLMAFDLDGTLAESKARVSAEMGELLARLMQKMPVAIMSGAGFPQFEIQFLPAIPSDAHLENLYLFPTNAASCYSFVDDTWKPAYQLALSSEEKSRIYQALDEALKESGLIEPPAQVWGERIEDRGTQISFSGLGQQAPVEEKKKWDPTHTKKRALREALEPKLPECTVTMSGSTTVDITQKGINKAYGVKQLAGLTGISVSEMLYVGDALQEGGNDYVVIETGVRTHPVFGHEETAKVIETVLAQHKM
jgi:phosphomannomutase